MGSVHNTVQALLNEFDVAGITGMSVASVRRWRANRRGPRYIKLGTSVRYRPEDVKSFIDELADRAGQRRSR